MTPAFDLSVFNAFTGPIILKALIVGVLTSVCASILGVPLVLKRYSMIGDGLSHTGFFALALASLFGVAAKNELFFTMPVVVFAAVVLLLISESGRIKGDAAVAMISTGAVAVGYLIFNLSGKGTADVCSSMFGANISKLDMSDVWISSALAAGVILVFILLYPRIFAFTFDPSFARSTGAPVKLLGVLRAVLTAVTIVVGMKMIGAIIISAVIVFPAMTAMAICKHFKKVIALSAAFAVVNFILGLFIASTLVFRMPDGSVRGLYTGPCIVALNGLSLLTVTCVRKIADASAKRRAKRAEQL